MFLHSKGQVTTSSRQTLRFTESKQNAYRLSPSKKKLFLLYYLFQKTTALKTAKIEYNLN
jgi:hypothetical protein